MQWIVGTGGKGSGGNAAPGSRLPNSQASEAGAFGVSKLTPNAGSYDWNLLPIAGTFTDTGSRACT